MNCISVSVNSSPLLVTDSPKVLTLEVMHHGQRQAELSRNGLSSLCSAPLVRDSFHDYLNRVLFVFVQQVVDTASGAGTNRSRVRPLNDVCEREHAGDDDDGRAAFTWCTFSTSDYRLE